MTCMMKTIGFIGLGRMGFPMASHLLRAGYEVLAWDKNVDAISRFHSEGGPRIDSAYDVARRCEILITMLPTSGVVREVVLGTRNRAGLAVHLRPGSVLVDMGTSDPFDTRELGAALAARQITVLDAPVCGGVIFAKDGTLDILIGGERGIAEKITPILLSVGRSVTYCGPLGSAHAMKALNNYVNAAVLAVYLEAISAGQMFGIDFDVMVKSLETATLGRNHPFEKKLKAQILSRRFASGMAIGLISKDVEIAQRLVKQVGFSPAVIDRVAELWKAATRRLGFEQDQTKIVQIWEEVAGAELALASRSDNP